LKGTWVRLLDFNWYRFIWRSVFRKQIHAELGVLSAAVLGQRRSRLTVGILGDRARLSRANLIGLLMCVAWLSVALSVANTALLRFRPAFAIKSQRTRAVAFSAALIASIVIASLVFGYNAAITAAFAEPDFRYRQMASSAKTDEERQGLLELARTWTQAALLERQFLDRDNSAGAEAA
jgi:hypothetical protein